MKKKRRRIAELIQLGIGIAIVMIVFMNIMLPMANSSVYANGTTPIWGTGTVGTITTNTFVLTAILPLSAVAAAIYSVWAKA